MAKPFRFGVVAGTAGSAAEWVARARRVEELGYATLLIPDTSFTFAPMVALAAAAAATTTLRVGTWVLAPTRNAVMLAHEAATLDYLSGGRFELGLGAGRDGVEGDYRTLGVPVPSAGARVEQLALAIATVRARWLAPDMAPKPVQKPGPPIVVAGSGPRVLGLAAREADVVALGVSPMEDEAAVSARLDRIRDAAGARFGQLEIAGSLLVVGDKANPYMLKRLGTTPADLMRLGSASAIGGSLDEMCDQLRARRDRLGISYIAAPEDVIDQLAPVVERLSGR